MRRGIRNVLRPLVRGLRGVDPNAGLDAGRTELIDVTFRRFGPRSFADLGGVWGVDGGYTFYAIERYRPDRAVLVDGTIFPWVRDRARRVPELELLEANFADPTVRRAVGHVDVIFLFDTLLHQVRPDWDEVLQLWSRSAQAVVIYNPQWVGGAETVRLLALGEQEYFENVPHSPTDPCRSAPTGARSIPAYSKSWTSRTQNVGVSGATSTTSGSGGSPTSISPLS